LFKIADELEIDLQDNHIHRVHRVGQKKNKENPRPIIARFVTCNNKKRFLTNKRDLKSIDGNQHVFVCEDLTPLKCVWHFGFLVDDVIIGVGFALFLTSSADPMSGFRGSKFYWKVG